VWEPNAQVGELRCNVTGAGHAIDVPGPYQLHELEDIVSRADL